VARLIRRAVPWLLFLALIAAGYLFGRDYVAKHPQDVPWTALRLDDPVGAFTLRKLSRLSQDAAQCRALLAAANSGDRLVPPRRSSPECGYDDGMRITPAPGGAAFSPEGVVTRCAVAASLVVWERQVLQPAAERHFGARVDAVEHAGSFSCRRLYGRSEGAFSEHATANAIDVIGFRFDDGTRVSVLNDWAGAGSKGDFLREIRDGACDLFATVLGPDYNAAHADHLHFDHASRGQSGFGLCR
jgi:hypothetical protein